MAILLSVEYPVVVLGTGLVVFVVVRHSAPFIRGLAYLIHRRMFPR